MPKVIEHSKKQNYVKKSTKTIKIKLVNAHMQVFDFALQNVARELEASSLDWMDVDRKDFGCSASFTFESKKSVIRANVQHSLPVETLRQLHVP